jgi:predicted DNA-binding transcriptional regulator AlpA
MTTQDLRWLPQTAPQSAVRVIRHKQVCQKLQISSAKLFDMVAKKQFLKPFTLIPGGRAVGWLEQDVDRYILDRKDAQEAA